MGVGGAKDTKSYPKRRRLDALGDGGPPDAPDKSDITKKYLGMYSQSVR